MLLMVFSLFWDTVLVINILPLGRPIENTWALKQIICNILTTKLTLDLKFSMDTAHQELKLCFRGNPLGVITNL